MKFIYILSFACILLSLNLNAQEKRNNSILSIVNSINNNTINNVDSLILTLESILNTGYDNIDIFTNGNIYGKLEKNENFEKLLQRSRSNYFYNTKDIDTNITSIIREAIIHDQGIRKYYKLIKGDSIIESYCKKKMNEIDSIYRPQIATIIDKNEYPGFSIVGAMHQDDAFIIIQHYSSI